MAEKNDWRNWWIALYAAGAFCAMLLIYPGFGWPYSDWIPAAFAVFFVASMWREDRRK